MKCADISQRRAESSNSLTAFPSKTICKTEKVLISSVLLTCQPSRQFNLTIIYMLSNELYSLKKSQTLVEWRAPPTHQWHVGNRPDWPYPPSVTDAPRLHFLVLLVVTTSAFHSQRTRRSPSVQGVKITRLPPDI
ncbi:hypothetical protein NPIL_194411 [Nephila pilipes]|uniref:Uncharacterized protein n=1 Tax=Nephila pilipes TaxID=299642 RepID=A0A8X6MCK2_NEPPI|nr:hypothetical protein NPIL_194411 [Nephila pilipes]